MIELARELNEATNRALRMYAVSRNPLLEDPIALRPHMHCGAGS